ncbi:MAG: metallophosphoesterase [Spirochaetales bacterium]|uniref:Metallophosphoesterase n=1 Tax=Candidatus Thalassospirochaeta sargassi TaxID=3119039 RepID=A0AAJ1IE40_9SPIO|nr:metallophosphoesterase [Spirochaetales bacterium]
MRIGILSDIHVDINYYEENVDKITPAVCDAVLNNNIDVFITAGDIASDYEITLDVVRRIERASSRDCLFVSGNHDLWNENHPGMTAMETYGAMAEHPYNLANGPVKLKDGWTAVGDTCWYDYSFGSSELYSFEDFERRSNNERVWQDSIKAVWNRPDAEVNDWFLKRLESSIAAAGNDDLIAVSHMLPIEEFTVPVPDETWDYFNAFLGSRRLGELLMSSGRVKYSICGHVHYRKHVVKNGIDFFCQCLGYRTEWKDNDDPFIEVANSMKIIEI